MLLYCFLFEKSSDTLKSLKAVISHHADNIFDAYTDHIVSTGSSAVVLKRELDVILATKIASIRVQELEFLSSYGGICILKEIHKQRKSTAYNIDKIICLHLTNNFSKSFQFNYNCVNKLDESYLMIIGIKS